jgi:hypothetical protein
MSAGVLYACNGAHHRDRTIQRWYLYGIPSSPVRKRERETRRICPEFLFLKGMTGALVPFSYLVHLDPLFHLDPSIINPLRLLL